MKRYFRFTVSGLFSATALFSACSKGTYKDPQQPAVQLTAPVSNQVYTSGDARAIEESVTDNRLHELRLKITSGSTVLFSKTNSIHNVSVYTIDESRIASAGAVTNAVVTVEAEDMDMHIVTQTVNITINP